MKNSFRPGARRTHRAADAPGRGRPGARHARGRGSAPRGEPAGCSWRTASRRASSRSSSEHRVPVDVITTSEVSISITVDEKAPIDLLVRTCPSWPRSRSCRTGSRIGRRQGPAYDAGDRGPRLRRGSSSERRPDLSGRLGHEPHVRGRRARMPEALAPPRGVLRGMGGPGGRMKALIVGPGRMGRAIEPRSHHPRTRRRGPRGPPASSLRRPRIRPASTWRSSSRRRNRRRRLVDALLEHRDPGRLRHDRAGTSAPRAESSAGEAGAVSALAELLDRRRRRRGGPWPLARTSRRSPSSSRAYVERHHSAKKDAPSGTPRRSPRPYRRRGAEGHRSRGGSLRQGGQPGEHVVVFEGAGRDDRGGPPRRARARSSPPGRVQAAEWLRASGLAGTRPLRRASSRGGTR